VVAVAAIGAAVVVAVGVGVVVAAVAEAASMLSRAAVNGWPGGGVTAATGRVLIGVDASGRSGVPRDSGRGLFACGNAAAVGTGTWRPGRG
jgi:hypothetical protein